MPNRKPYRNLNALLAKNEYSEIDFSDFLGEDSPVTQLEVLEQHNFEGALYIRNSQ